MTVLVETHPRFMDHNPGFGHPENRERLRAVLDGIADAGLGDAGSAFCAVRPPGHHATPKRPMGFCLINSAAVAAAVLAERGERVRFEPTWVVASSGFDAHRADPLTNLGLDSGDFAAFTKRALELAPEGRLVMFLEGGYDLDALSRSAAACVAVMAGAEREEEPRTSGGPGRDVVEEAKRRMRLG